MKITIGGRAYQVSAEGERVVVEGEPFPVRVEGSPSMYTARVKDRVFRIQVKDACPPTVQLVVDGISYEVVVEGLTVAPRRGPAVAKATAAEAPGAVKAQMTGKVVLVRVKVGERVEDGDVLLVLEAMKMENEIHAPKGGVVKQVAVTSGAQVALGDLLIVIE